MSTETTADHDTAEARFRDELIVRALKLSAKERNGLSLLIVKELGEEFAHLEAERQTWRDEVARRSAGVSPVVDPGTCITPELMAEVAKLTDDGREWLDIALIGAPDGPEGTPEEIRQAWREEIRRRLKSIENGTAKFHTVEETLAYLDKLCGPDGES